jgi:NAD-dependent dihydropyrimidine dehydrogenase PreA subunit
MVKIIVNSETCSGCETCVNTCPVGVYEMRNGKTFQAKEDDCLVCRGCEVQCPTESIQVIE